MNCESETCEEAIKANKLRKAKQAERAQTAKWCVAAAASRCRCGAVRVAQRKAMRIHRASVSFASPFFRFFSRDLVLHLILIFLFLAVTSAAAAAAFSLSPVDFRSIHLCISRCCCLMHNAWDALLVGGTLRRRDTEPSCRASQAKCESVISPTNPFVCRADVWPAGLPLLKS